ncbi:MAG TPA: ABC transporter permease [Candidatus Acidoferrum sp.]|nr:ABC transporter permease [Candidatus Acidoferrum sp.]
MSNFASLTHMRIRLALRNKMFFFFSIVMPFIFFFGYLGFFGKSVPAGAAYFLGPVLALNVMGSFWGLSATIVTFREQGILRRFHVSPVRASDLLASSVVANLALTLPTVILELLLARLIFQVRTLDNLGGIFVLVAVGTISFASLGLVIASVTNTMQETQILNQLIWLPLIFLSGATLPLAYLPRVVQRVGLFLPATYLVNAFQQVIINSATVLSRYTEIASLVSWAILTFFLSMQLFRWEPETKIPRRAKLLVLATAIPFVLLGVWENRTDRILQESQAAFGAFQTVLDSLRPGMRMTLQPGSAVNAPKPPK